VYDLLDLIGADIPGAGTFTDFNRGFSPGPWPEPCSARNSPCLASNLPMTSFGENQLVDNGIEINDLQSCRAILIKSQLLR
jgi:hypothetical protein